MSTSGSSSSSTPGGIGLPTSGDIDSSSNADDIVISYSDKADDNDRFYNLLHKTKQPKKTSSSRSVSSSSLRSIDGRSSSEVVDSETSSFSHGDPSHTADIGEYIVFDALKFY
ncbi:hypothetical protein INT46_004286 [Mucor plumbeus]|uniref:Uncharacterized protein n=1 Tax=Mucor plumbeus TaxID=97098 RepID=A0A8H7QNM4_9FUNG|nr:hypothetical protein INT46_004286 [Mucor plumbeus]